MASQVRFTERVEVDVIYARFPRLIAVEDGPYFLRHVVGHHVTVLRFRLTLCLPFEEVQHGVSISIVEGQLPGERHTCVVYVMSPFRALVGA